MGGTFEHSYDFMASKLHLCFSAQSWLTNGSVTGKKTWKARSHHWINLEEVAREVEKNSIYHTYRAYEQDELA